MARAYERSVRETHEICARRRRVSRRQAAWESARNCFGADDRYFREVVRADEERVVVKDLSTGWLEVGVVQTYERVAEEGDELTAGPLPVGARVTRSLHHLCQVRLDLQFSVMAGVDAWRPVNLSRSE